VDKTGLIHRRAPPLTTTTILYSSFSCKPELPFQFAGLPENFFFDAAWADAPDGCVNWQLRSGCEKFRLGCEKNRRLRSPDLPAKSPTSTLPPNFCQPSVDKPMHIHRIKCAKPAELDTADLLSS
jgi:hypothetical protein